MTWTRVLSAIVLTTLIADSTPAQFIIPAVTQPGIEFRAGSNRLGIRGFIPTGNPYGVLIPVIPGPGGLQQVGPAFVPYGPAVYGSIERRMTVQIINPPAVYVPSRGPDLSGIDLDVEPPSKIWGNRNDIARAGPARKGEALPAPKKNEFAKVAPPPEEKKPAIVNPPAKPQPLDGERLMELGTDAFRNGDFGLAILRYRNAFLDDASSPRSLFLQGQAYLAIGKYREAADSIQRGLRRLPDWPTSGFKPKVELYAMDADSWIAHRKTLEGAQRAQPQNADLLFLLGYLAWFDNQRDAAIDYFQQSRALAAEPRWADAFLKLAAAKQ